MKFIIVASEKDPAGMNILDSLKNLNSKILIKIVKDGIIHADSIDKLVEADFIIFASKHQAKIHSKTLTVHTTGNFNENTEHGGKPNTLNPTNPFFFKHLFKTLNSINKKTDSEYQVTLEATHHGPFLETPSLFIELGSSEEEWYDQSGAEIIAKSIVKAIETFKESDYSHKVTEAFGIGGPHYCPNFNNIQLNSNFALTHICANYNLPLTEENIQELINKNKTKISTVLLDIKGLGNSEQKNKVLEILNKHKLKIIKTSDAKLKED